MSERRRRRWPWLVLSIVAALIIGVPLWVAPALIPAALTYAPNSKGVPAAEAEVREPGVDRALRVRVGPPAAELSVWIVSPTKTPAPTVLVLHGVRDGKQSMLGWGRRLAGAGHRAVLVDLRGQGRSSGEHLTFGVLERRDLSQLLDELLKRRLVSPPLGAFGVSYGAATAIQLAGVDGRIEAVVAVAPFADLRSVVPSYLRHYLPGLGWLVPAARVRRAIDEAGRRAGFDPDEASPVELVKRARARVLILHGDEDSKIPPEHSRRIAAAAPARVSLVVVPGRDHDDITGDPAVAARALPFLRSLLR